MPRRSSLAPEALTHLRLPAGARISPDGRWVAFVVRHADLTHDRDERTLHLVEVGASGSQRVAATGLADAAPSWMPDSRALLFVAAGDVEGEERLWRVDVAGHAPTPIATYRGHIAEPRVAPNGKSVAFLFTPREGAWTHLWVLDLATKRARQITSGDYDDAQPDWSPDSRSIVFVSDRAPRADAHRGSSDLFIIRARGGPLRQATHDRGPKCSPAWSPDGRTVAFLGHLRWPDIVDNLHVWSVQVRGGPAADLMPESELMCDARVESDGREAASPPPRLHWTPDGRRIHFVATANGASNVWELDARGGAPRQRTFGAHVIAAISPSRDGRRWAFVRSTATSPGEVHVAEAESGRRSRSKPRGGEALLPGARVHRLTRLGDAPLARRNITAAEELRIPWEGRHEIQAWVLRSKRAGARGPAVLVIHADPYAAFGWSFVHEFQWLVARGYHVVYANLRGSAGYGRQFMRALVGQWGTTDYDDLLRVTDAIERLPFVDRSRIAIAGDVYGGYLAAWAIGHTRRYRCAVASRGAFDLVSLHGTSDMGARLAAEFEDQRPWEAHERWWRVSPLAHVANIRTPLLLMHPEADRHHPLSQAQEMFTALQVLGRDVELVRSPGAEDGFARSDRPLGRAERLHRIVDWLDRKL